MDQSYSEGDVSLSPSQILERLQMLRQWQLLQRGKLQKQQLQYMEGSDNSSNITELVSHFSSSTSYNTFRSLLQSSQDNTNEISPQVHSYNTSKKSNLQNGIDGISVLNLSQESECITNSPITSRSEVSPKDAKDLQSIDDNISQPHTLSKNILSLDDMPILSPKKDFEALVREKLTHESSTNDNNNKIQNVTKPFLRKGQGTERFGLRKNDFIIQNTKSLPWKKKGLVRKLKTKTRTSLDKKDNIKDTNVQVKKVIGNTSVVSPLKISNLPLLKKSDVKINSLNINGNNVQTVTTKILTPKNSENTNTCSTGKQPVNISKEKTWAAVFTKEQDDFLRKLKQSAYYKNFASPAKSIVSDISCDEQTISLRKEKEETEQDMFDLIEHKVSHDSFAIDNSFFTRFIKKNEVECSGESTPLVLQKCLYKNPNLMHILPDVKIRKQNDESCSVNETSDSDCTECSENCASSCCCSCKTITQSNINKSNQHLQNNERGQTDKNQLSKYIHKDKMENVQCHNDSMTATNAAMSANLAEMNSKLIATSELLKDRLKELEDEIETFRKENASLNKMREEIDLERQKFYEEKNSFEQKFNEEKVLSEYYLAEEKDKLSKQKQMYERYVRDIKGQLNKKEKDEVVNLKKEMLNLKEEIRIKDAKTTSTTARLRNQVKLLEKEKKNLQDEVEKFKKENKRIQHSNEITRRLTNLKYLDEINKKLSNMVTRDKDSVVQLDSDVKYRSYEIERQSRNRNSRPVTKSTIKQRAKSVPNLNVTSRYAKYFSQKDCISEQEKNKKINDCYIETFRYSVNDELVNDINISDSIKINSDSEEENKLEKIYNERFRTPSPKSDHSSTSISTSVNSPELSNDKVDNNRDFFIKKPVSNLKVYSSNKNLSSHDNSVHNKESTNQMQLSLSSRKMSTDYQMPNRHQSTKSTTSNSNLSNSSSSSQRSNTVINKEQFSDTRFIPSPEPTSKTSLTKTNLNPIEIRKPDGTKELKFPNGNIKLISANGKYSKFIYYNGDIKENFYNEGRIKYYYAETKTFHTTQPDGLEILEFPDGQVEKRYKDGSSEIRLPNGSVRYYDPKNEHVREEWRFPDGAALTVSANGEQRIVFPNGQIEVHAKDHKRREFPDGTIKLIYNDGTSETRYASGRVRIKDKHGNLIMDSAS